MKKKDVKTEIRLEGFDYEVREKLLRLTLEKDDTKFTWKTILNLIKNS